MSRRIRLASAYRFRDLLRSRPELAAAYAALKRELAARHGHERAAYTDAKTGFIAAALRAGHPGS